MDGWVKLPRNIVHAPWYQSIPARVVYIQLLIRAEYEGESGGLKRGEVITSFRSLAQETGLSERQVRTGLAILGRNGEAILSPTRGYTVVKLVKYSETQGEKKATHQTTQEETHQTTQLDIVLEQGFIGEKDTVSTHQTTHQATQEVTTSKKYKEINNTRARAKVRYFLSEQEAFALVNTITESQGVREAACEWVRMRYAKKGEHRLTEKAIRGAFSKLRKLGYTTERKAIACFNQSVEHLWDGIFPLSEG